MILKKKITQNNKVRVSVFIWQINPDMVEQTIISEYAIFSCVCLNGPNSSREIKCLYARSWTEIQVWLYISHFQVHSHEHEHSWIIKCSIPAFLREWLQYPLALHCFNSSQSIQYRWICFHLWTGYSLIITNWSKQTVIGWFKATFSSSIFNARIVNEQQLVNT